MLGAARLRGGGPERKRARPSWMPWWAILVPGIFYAGDIGVWHWSVELTTVANATLLANAAPIFVTLLAWLLFGERTTRGFLAGMAAAFAGVALLMSKSLQLSPQYLLGDLLGVATALFYAGYQLSASRLRGVYGTVEIMTWVAIAGSVLLGLWVWGSGESFLWEGAQTGGWSVLLALAFLSQVCGQGLIVYALGRLPAPFTSVTLLVQPVVAMAAAWLLLQEALAPVQLLGAVIVLAGIQVARHASGRRIPVTPA